jgi:hypothetical protein
MLELIKAVVLYIIGNLACLVVVILMGAAIAVPMHILNNGGTLYEARVVAIIIIILVVVFGFCLMVLIPLAVGRQYRGAMRLTQPVTAPIILGYHDRMVEAERGKQRKASGNATP